MKLRNLIFVTIMLLGFGMAYGQITELPNGNVGIGNPNPNQKLVVAGNTINEGQFIKIGKGVTGGLGVKIELGEGRDDDGAATIDLVSDKSNYPDFGARFVRFADGNTQFQHAGTMPFVFNALHGAVYFFQNSGVNKAFIDVNGIMAGGDAIHDLGSASNRWKDVWASNGTIQTSDARTKNTVQNSEYGLDAVLDMRPVTFYWNENREQGRKVGLIAQEVQEVVSEVVYDKTISIDADGNKTVTPTELLGLNYAELVPILIKAIQEQQTQIDELSDMITLLQDRGETQTHSSQSIILGQEAMLDQNRPNPSDKFTQIDYYVPESARKAELVIFNLDGRVLSSVAVDTFGKGILNIDVTEFGSGVYLYTLVVDGEVIDSRKMTIAR